MAADLTSFSSRASSGATAIQPATAPEEKSASQPERLPIPPAAPRPPLRVAPAGTDVIVVFLVLLAAFFLASMPSRTSDFWRHLATGQSLLNGEYQFGADSFSFASSGIYWDNHSWLYEVILYALFQVLPGPALVILKALLVAALAGVLMACGRMESTTVGLVKGGGLWLPAVATALAVTAMAPWLALKPITVSFFFLALTLWFLERGTVRSYWPLLLLFVFWVNLDSWFLVGPFTVGLYVVGKLWSGPAPERGTRDEGPGVRQDSSPHAPDPSPLASAPANSAVPKVRWALGLVGVLAAAWAVCLINPHHLWAFRVPREMFSSDVAAELQSDFWLSKQYLNPFRDLYFPPLFTTAAGLAFWILVLAGGLSFVLNWGRFPAGRVVLFGGFLILAFLQTHLIPFFAVVAGPVLALNFGEVLAARWAVFFAEPAWEGGIRAGRMVLVFSGLALAAAAWAGWLQGPPYGPRRWTLEADASLEQAARQISQWRRQGILADTDNGFALSPEVANYFAWSCPEEKGFLDSRLLLSPRDANDFVAIRDALLDLGRRDTPPNTAWRALLRKRHINHLVVYGGTDRKYNESVVSALVSPAPEKTNSDEWPLLYMKGGVAIFGWRDPQQPAAADRFAKMKLSLDQQAFDPAPEQTAPVTWAGREPQPYQWWDAFWKPKFSRSPDLDEASMALAYHDALREQFIRRHLRLWDIVRSVDLVARAPSPGLPPLEECLEILQPLAVQRAYLFAMGQDAGPRAPLYLAIRAVRRALHAGQIDNPQAYFLLGQAYDRLSNSRERAWSASNGILERIRKVQITYAYSQTVRLEPDHVDAHIRLVDLYQASFYVDLMVKHMNEVLRLHRARGPQLGENPQEFGQRLTKLREAIDMRQKEIDDQERQFDLKRGQMSVIDRAQEARNMGLAGKALETLLKKDYAAFGPRGMDLELNLLLGTGAMDKVRAWLKPEHEKIIGAQTYRIDLAQLGYASGDYREADAHLAASIDKVRGVTPQPVEFHKAALFLFGRAVLENYDGLISKIRLPLVMPGTTEGGPTTYTVLPDSTTMPFVLWGLAGSISDQADITVVRGLLALEAGQTDQARELLHESQVFWRSRTCADLGGRASQAGPQIAEEILGLLERSKRPANGNAQAP